MKDFISKYWIVVVIPLFCFAISFSILHISKIVDQNEIVECNQWQQQADVYPSFFLSKWQDEQCRAHKIIINAEVK